MTRIIFVYLAFFLACATPSIAQQINTPIAAESSSEEDAQIAIRLRDILGELGTYSDVTVVVSDGVVTFRGTTETTAQATELDALANRMDGVVAVRNEVVETADLARRLDPAWDRFTARVEQVMIKLPLVIVAAVLFSCVVAVGFLVARNRWPWDNIAPNAFIADIYRQLVRIAFVILGIVLALDVLNATALLSTILGAAGIVGLAIGFAVRDTVENFIASVLLSFRQPFRPNDTIEINGDQGKVIRLTSRATILLSFDGNQIRIPNATVFKSRIVNFSKNAERRFKFEVLIDRNADLGAAKDLIVTELQAQPYVIETPAAACWIDRLEPSGAAIVVAGWVNQEETSLLLAQSEAIRMVKRVLQDANIGLVDATQAISITRPVLADGIDDSHESADVADVDASEDEALDDLIVAERENKESENLLRDGALSE